MAQWRESQIIHFNLAQSKLSPIQQQSIQKITQIISNLSSSQYKYLQQLVRSKFQTYLGYDPALNTDFYPKLTQISDSISDHQFNFSPVMFQNSHSSIGLVNYVFQGNSVDLSASPQAAVEEEPEEAIPQKSNFDVLITGFSSDSKVKLIKELKNLLGIGLKDAKEQIQSIVNQPLMIGKGAPKAHAEELADKFRELGAEMELK